MSIGRILNSIAESVSGGIASIEGQKMTWRWCFFFIFIQGLLLFAFITMNRIASPNYINAMNWRMIKTALGTLFVLISPFGVLSLYASVAFWITAKSTYLSELLLKNRKRHPIATYPSMFLVWKELRNDVFLLRLGDRS